MECLYRGKIMCWLECLVCFMFVIKVNIIIFRSVGPEIHEWSVHIVGKIMYLLRGGLPCFIFDLKVNLIIFRSTAAEYRECSACIGGKYT